MARALRGALLLARGDVAGAALIDGSPAGALRSVTFVLLCLPGFVAVLLLSWTIGEPPAVGIARGVATEVLSFVLAWAGFLLASLTVAEAMGCQGRWPAFVAAWNYTNVVQYGLLLLVGGVVPVFGLPDMLVQVMGLAAFVYVFWLEWFVARVVLGASQWRAMGLVALDLMVSLFAIGVVGRLAGL